MCEEDNNIFVTAISSYTIKLSLGEGMFMVRNRNSKDAKQTI